jgi:glycosyltransferase involved in cell wall biosynthesis
LGWRSENAYCLKTNSKLQYSIFASEERMKKVLYIIYYWPPCGGISVLRNLKFVKYFRDFGWEPVVYAPENANYPVIDETTFKDIPPGVEVLKTPVIEPFGIFNLLQGKKKDERVKDVFLVRDEKPGLAHKLGVWVRGNFFIPDARMLWINPSVRYLRKYLRSHHVDAMISYGPPHSTHRIAYALKQEFGIPWVADFQDPWTEIDYFEKFMLTDFARNKHKRQEQEVLKTADKVVMVSKSWCQDLAALGGRPVGYIPFGFDHDDFNQKNPISADPKFTISHFGTLGIDRNPEELWTVLAELSAEDPEFRNALQIDLAGVVDYSIFEAIEKNGLKSNLQYHLFLTKDKVVPHMLSSAILLLLLNKGFGEYNVKGRIPAKLFEYLGSKRPIMVIGNSGSDVARIIAETNGGITIDYPDHQALKNTITEFYKAWKEGRQLYLPEHIEEYNFRNLTGKMAGLLDEISQK